MSDTFENHHETAEAAFTLSVNVRRLSKKGQWVNYQADEEVCAKIAADYDLIEVASFTGRCLLAPWKKDGVKLTGTISASIVQPCAASGNPLPQQVEEDFEAIFLPENSRLTRPVVNGEGEMILNFEGEDSPETFAGDSIDVALVWLEFFALGLDPFARIEGEEFATDAYRSKEDSPFAALQALKDTSSKH